MGSLIERIHIAGLPPEIQVVLIAAMPVLELRGAIPYGVWALKLSPLKALILALIGNLLIIIPLLYLIDIFMERLKSIELGRRWIERVKTRADVVERYEALGLFLFVAIPLPGTGAWTGALAALLFGIRKRLAIPAIGAGVVLAGIIITGITTLGIVKGIVIGVIGLLLISKVLDLWLRKG